MPQVDNRNSLAVKRARIDGEVSKQMLPRLLDATLYFLHLAVFGILGVLTRYLLQRLFEPRVARITSHESILYPDLFANLVGSYLMGWFGFVFEGHIFSVSKYLAAALEIGYLGSLTTFTAWNQEILDLSLDGKWVSSFFCFSSGFYLVNACFSFGVKSALAFKTFLVRRDIISVSAFPSNDNRIESLKHHLAVVMVALMLILGILWGVSGTTLEKRKFKRGSSEVELWLPCIASHLGVWIRWMLAPLNFPIRMSRRRERAYCWKWIPWGTLIANVTAACGMALLEKLKKAEVINTSIASAIQLGLLSCLSSVSTFVYEFQIMKEIPISKRKGYAYAILTFGLSFVFGTLIYSIPMWLLLAAFGD